MSREPQTTVLTKEQIEEISDDDGPVSPDKWQKLCKMALAYLELQEQGLRSLGCKKIHGVCHGSN